MVQLMANEANVKPDVTCCTSDRTCGWRGTWSFFNLSGQLSRQTARNSQGIHGCEYHLLESYWLER